MFTRDGVNCSFMEESRLNDLAHNFGDLRDTFALAEGNMATVGFCVYCVTRSSHFQQPV